MKEQTIRFAFEAETKNKFRYQETVAAGAAPIVGTLYLAKEFVGAEAAKEVTLTVTLNS